MKIRLDRDGKRDVSQAAGMARHKNAAPACNVKVFQGLTSWFFIGR